MMVKGGKIGMGKEMSRVGSEVRKHPAGSKSSEREERVETGPDGGGGGPVKTAGMGVFLLSSRISLITNVIRLLIILAALEGFLSLRYITQAAR